MTTTRSRRTSYLLAAALFVAAGSAARASDVRFQTVALTGEPAPGLGPLAFDWFSDPRLNSSGQVAFWADLAGPGVSENTNGSIWTNRTGSLAMVMREGDPAPVGAGLVWGSFPAPSFHDRLAFTASLFDPAQPTLPTNLGIFREINPGGGTEKVAREGETPPGTFVPPVTFANLPLVPFSSDGHMAFAAINGLAIWSNRTGTLNPVKTASSGGTGVGDLFHGRLSNPYQRTDGRIAFFSPLLNPPGTLTSQPVAYGLFSDFSGQFFPIAVTGQSISVPNAIKYKEVSAHPAIERNPTNPLRLAYWATLMEGGVTPLNDSGLWVVPSQTTGLPLVREGDPAPGAGSGVFFGGFSRHPGLAAEAGGPSGFWLAFQASLVGEGISSSNNSGLWLTRNNPNPGAPSLIAREGAQVPRLPAGTLYASFSDPVVNTEGQVVFLARLRGPAVTSDTSLVLMATERASGGPSFAAGSAAPLVRMGDAFPVAAAQTRKVDEIFFDEGQPGSGRDALTNAGSLIFKLGFKDPIVPPPPPPQLGFSFTQGVFTATLGCLADINADGALTVGDFGAFQTAFVAANLRVCDFTEDGLLSIADFAAFQTAFVSGCP
jgi:hypothetical protein